MWSGNVPVQKTGVTPLGRFARFGRPGIDMCGFGLTKRWWGKGALIALAFLILVGAGTFLFDRNSDGVDDGGLDFWTPQAAPVAAPLFSGVAIISLTLTSALLLPGFLSSPRSPPTLLLSA